MRDSPADQAGAGDVRIRPQAADGRERLQQTVARTRGLPDDWGWRRPVHDLFFYPVPVPTDFARWYNQATAVYRLGP